jgi:hypothetical protein
MCKVDVRCSAVTIVVVHFGNLQTGRTPSLCSPGNKSKQSCAANDVVYAQV